jgi:hypothetical protein
MYAPKDNGRLHLIALTVYPLAKALYSFPCAGGGNARWKIASDLVKRTSAAKPTGRNQIP